MKLKRIIYLLLAVIPLLSSCMKEMPDSMKDYTVSKDIIMKASVESLSFAAAEGSDNFKITSNISWNVTSSQTWCTVSPSSGTGNGTITVKVAENNTIESRSATITVEAGELSQTIAVTQAGATPNLKLNTSTMAFGASAGNDNFKITSNISWSITSSQSWCTVSSSSGKGVGTITVNVSENKSIDSRSATITVKADNFSQTIAVTQAGANPELKLNKSSLSFSSSKGSDNFKITSNISWSITSSQSWCTVSTSSGSGDGTITINVTENKSTDSRSATITVKGGDLSQTISVTQAGANATLKIDKSSLSFGSSGGSDSFFVSSNTSWHVKSNQSWCTVSTSSAIGDEGVTVNVQENTSTQSRSATITVKGGDLSQTVSVKQDGVSSTGQSSRTFTVNGVSFKMIRVDGGTFTMGATSEQGSDARDDEKPTHSVTLSTYFMGETEVTQELWQAVMGSNPSYFKGSQRPVECVSWNYCQDFIKKLNSLTGQNFRLPTEAEWEFAARGGNNSRAFKYAGSNAIDDVAWYYSDSETNNVAQKSPNELGLYDMSGNVWEWCQDWYGSYSSSSQTNPTGPSSGSYRVNRGGSWYYFAWCCRVSCRYFNSSADRLDDLGLRLAL